MGTFHSDKGELHGITVVVRTKAAVYVGRCDTVTGDGVYLLQADRHEEGQDGKSNQEFLQAAAQWGHWPRIDSVLVPSEEVEGIARLAELTR